MASIPVYCPSCRALFASRAFQITGSVRNLTLAGNRETCPNCGKMASIVDGVFDSADGVLKLIDGPQFTKEILEKFSALVVRAQRQEINSEQLRDEASKLDPKLGAAVERAKASGLPFWTAVLLLSVTALHSCKIDAKIDLNRAFDQAISTVEKITSESTTSKRR